MNLNSNLLSDFEILPISKLHEYLKLHKHSENRWYQLPTNHAYIYEMANNEVVMIPSGSGQIVTNGILFHKKTFFEKCVNEDYFPIENPEKEVFESAIVRILEINNNIDFFFQHINETLQQDEKIIDRSYIIRSYPKFLSRHLAQTLNDLDYVSFGIILGESFRLENGGKWLLIKRYGPYNPYYEPSLLTPNGGIIDVFYFFSSILDTIPSDIESFYKSPYVLNPGRTIELMGKKGEPSFIIID